MTSKAKAGLMLAERFGSSAVCHRDEQDKAKYWIGYRAADGSLVWVAGSSYRNALHRHDNGYRGTADAPTAPAYAGNFQGVA